MTEGLAHRAVDALLIRMDRAASSFHRARRWILRETPTRFWSRHNVTNHRRFATADESLAFYQGRNSQYINYLRLMPVGGRDGQVVLDYGCGPGNDLVGFGLSSRPSRLIGVDVSPPSIEEARQRLKLHGIDAEFILAQDGDSRIPLADQSVDYVHSSGVLHHTANPGEILREFRRILRPGGEARIMVYNYDSLWLHLYIAYIVRRRLRMHTGMSVRAAFGRMADGEECPIAEMYTPGEFMALGNQAGFQSRFVGAAMHVEEVQLLTRRFEAIGHPDLEQEHRDFLMELEFDRHGLPTYRGQHAGIDGCFSLTLS